MDARKEEIKRVLRGHLTNPREAAAFQLGVTTIMRAMRATDDEMYDDLEKEFDEIITALKKEVGRGVPKLLLP